MKYDLKDVYYFIGTWLMVLPVTLVEKIPNKVIKYTLILPSLFLSIPFVIVFIIPMTIVVIIDGCIHIINDD